MRTKAFALLIVGLAAIVGCRSTGSGTGIQPGAGTGVSNPPPNPNPEPVTPPPAPVPTAAPSSTASEATGGGAPAYSAPPPAASVPDQPRVESTASVRPHRDVLKLKQAGLSDEFILNKIRTENVNYQLTTKEILELRSSGLSETVLEAMLRSGRPPA